jgi:hypothetical protein
MELSAENIGSNWNYFISLIELTISGERKNKLIEFYQERANRIALAPYSSRTSDVNCFAGGYIEHVLRVFECVEVLHTAWTSVAKSATYTKEELFFVALNHELGLIGNSNEEYFIPNKSDWHVKNRGEVYSFNSEIPYSLIPDRTLFLLQENGINISFNEMLGIKLHDGLYEKANEKYLTGYLAENRPRTSLVHIIHHASVMAKQIEFERDSTQFFKNVEIVEAKQEKIKEVEINKITPQITNNVQVPVSESIANLLNNFF